MKIDNKINIGLVVSIFIFGSVVGAVFGLYFEEFGFSLWQGLEQWAQTGDFFGGILNPLFAFMSLVFLVFTVRQNQIALAQNEQALSRTNQALEQNEQIIEQNANALEISNTELQHSTKAAKQSAKALKAQVKQINIQSFESTFFNMLSLHNQMLESTCYSEADSTTKSREAFSRVLMALKQCNSVISHYDDIQLNQNQSFGHYFRNLYQVLRFIDDNSVLLGKNKRKYINILRAQLSSDELALLFINCLSQYVDEGQFRELLVRYKMLEHLKIRIFRQEGRSIIKISNAEVILEYEHFERYLVPTDSGKFLSGAYGSNQVVERKLQSINAS